jgi:6-phospho-beta-glucosidase
VAGLAERILRREGWPGRLTTTTDRQAAIDGASFVLVQLRIGGQATRLVDETLPHRFGCIGQETTGPGGFAKALRTVPVVLELADDVGRRGASGAWIVDFTNPVGIVSQALIDAGHRALGLCNVAIGIQRRMAARFGVSPERVELEHVGLNHLTWIRAIRVDGVDRLPGLIADHVDELAAEVGSPAGLIRALGALPSYYLHYYYATRDVLAEQLAGGTRAEDVMAIERELLEMYRDPTLDRKPALLQERGGAFYSEAAAQLIASLHAGTGDVQVVDVRNDGAIPDLPAGAVVEVPARIDREGAHPLPLAPLAPEIRGLVQAAKAYEELAIRAATTGDRRIALLALLANPLVPDLRAAEGLLAAILEANAPFLPRFAAPI